MESGVSGMMDSLRPHTSSEAITFSQSPSPTSPTTGCAIPHSAASDGEFIENARDQYAASDVRASSLTYLFMGLSGQGRALFQHTPTKTMIAIIGRARMDETTLMMFCSPGVVDAPTALDHDKQALAHGDDGTDRSPEVGSQEVYSSSFTSQSPDILQLLSSLQSLGIDGPFLVDDDFHSVATEEENHIEEGDGLSEQRHELRGRGDSTASKVCSSVFSMDQEQDEAGETSLDSVKQVPQFKPHLPMYSSPPEVTMQVEQTRAVKPLPKCFLEPSRTRNTNSASTAIEVEETDQDEDDDQVKLSAKGLPDDGPSTQFEDGCVHINYISSQPETSV